MLEHFWQILLRGPMTRIQEPDLLIDHDSGGGGCHRFLGNPVEPFTYTGVNNNMKQQNHIKKPGVHPRKWFHFPGLSNSSSSRGTKGEAVSLSTKSFSEEKSVIVVHNNNNSIIVDMMMDENTRWSSSTTTHNNIPSSKSSSPTHSPDLQSTGVTESKTKSRLSTNTTNTHPSNNNYNSNKSKSNKNTVSNTTTSVSNKNNCGSNKNSGSNSGSSGVTKSPTITARINNCGAIPVTTSSSCTSPHLDDRRGGGECEDDESGARHLIIRYIHCSERPSKKQLVTLGVISVVFIIVLVVLLALFLSPSSRALVSRGNTTSRDDERGGSSDAFISSDITSSLNSDDGDLDDSDSYDDSDSSFYSSSTSSSNTNAGLDLKKVSKLSWDLLNSNQDASTRGNGGGGGGSSNGDKASSLTPLSGGSDGEIILPAKMIYTSSGDSTDLMPSEGGNKKRSCCRTQKYSQVIKRDGCEPLTIVNKMCFGQCVSVWVPGLFASFPVCRPSKSTFKMVTLSCGRNREKRKRVRIEKVRRCSCMEIEPTAASL